MNFSCGTNFGCQLQWFKLRWPSVPLRRDSPALAGQSRFKEYCPTVPRFIRGRPFVLLWRFITKINSGKKKKNLNWKYLCYMQIMQIREL